MAHRPLTAEILHCRHAHGRVWLDAFREGFERHGGKIRDDGDFAVMWGIRDRCLVTKPYLVLEQGYLGNRRQWTSIGWNGLNGRATFPKAPDGHRWERHFSHLLQPWRHHGEYSLLAGQVPGDQSIGGMNVRQWLRETKVALEARGHRVRVRAHPMHVQPERSLTDDLREAHVAVTYNSNLAVDAVLAGVPSVTLDQGSMAWPVTSHSLDEIVSPDRTAWAHKMAYTQWTIDEVASGMAWEHLRELT